jgi:hypothetical protein
MDQPRQLEDLIRQLSKLLVLGVLFLDHFPLQIRGGPTFDVGPALVDHHEGRFAFSGESASAQLLDS